MKDNLILNNDMFALKSVVPLFGEKETKGIATISRIHISKDTARWENLRLMRDAGYMFLLQEGHYARLHIKGELMMSDTPMERKSNSTFVQKANGKVLIAGLGLGLIIQAILDKEEVTEVVVIEKHQDVIDLVYPKFKSKKLKVICADIDEWKPSKEEKFDVIYFDIWADISVDNLEHIRKLHNKFKNSVNRANPNFYINSWMKEFLQARKRQEARDNWY